MTFVKEQWGLLGIKYKEITLISPYKVRRCDMKIACIDIKSHGKKRTRIIHGDASKFYWHRNKNYGLHRKIFRNTVYVTEIYAIVTQTSVIFSSITVNYPSSFFSGKKEGKSFCTRCRVLLDLRLNYTKVYLRDTNRNNWQYGIIVKMSNDWNRSTTENKIICKL